MSRALAATTFAALAACVAVARPAAAGGADAPPALSSLTGRTLRVTTSAGTTATGSLVATGPCELTLERSRRITSFAFPEISRVDRRTDHVVRGLVLGTALGLAAGGLVLAKYYDTDKDREARVTAVFLAIPLPIAGGVGGMLLGAAADEWRDVPLPECAPEG